MKRYIKVKDRWIDTLEAQKYGYYYYVVDDRVYVEHRLGKLQEETDEKALITSENQEYKDL